MNASDVRAALDRRWPAAEHVAIDEAPQDASRQGRKLDRLVVSCWRSRGLELDGVEIKVRRADWRKELENPEKADWWWHHVHRFWLACPTKLADQIRNELPSGWGLLACSESQTKPLVRPERHQPEPLPWTTVVGLLRTVNGAGWGALQREFEKGRDQGREDERRHSERHGADAALRSAHERLEAKVEAFEEDQ